MKSLVIFDSYFGNTEKIALSVSTTLGKESQAIRVQDLKPENLVGVELLIVGSPTRSFRPTESIMKFLADPAFSGLEGMKITAFDTRIELETIKSKFFRFVVDKGGYAAKYIVTKLVKKGGVLIAQPKGFLVTAESGPLRDGEEEMASEWAKTLVELKN